MGSRQVIFLANRRQPSGRDSTWAQARGCAQESFVQSARGRDGTIDESRAAQGSQSDNKLLNLTLYVSCKSTITMFVKVNFAAGWQSN
jgi:hypothetical protein